MGFLSAAFAANVFYLPPMCKPFLRKSVEISTQIIRRKALESVRLELRNFLRQNVREIA